MFRIKVFFLLMIFAVTLTAQDFEVSPVLMSFNANPGEIQKNQINIINHSGKPQKYQMKLSDYTTDKDGRKKSIPLGDNPRSCADWITLNPSLVELNPNQSGTIEVLMTVPKDGFNTRWCMIMAEAVEEQTAFEADKTLASGVHIIPRIVILVKQTPKSNKNFHAGISDLKEVTTAKDKFRKFEMLVTNTGDNIIEGSVYLDLADMSTAAEEKFEPVKVTVYPDASRVVILTVPKVIPPGKYALAAILDYGHRQPLEGTQLLLDVK
ncbi:MAG: hypothetical protein PHH37_14350 [Paludibacter sp.]|nr:hypothetical protein [Paludibacter sp.]